MDQKKIGSFLRELRKEQRITQEDLAEKLNVSSRTISRWETGSNMPDISLLIEIADFFDVSIPEIINGERKSEKMDEEVKEVAEKLSDYADAEKVNIIKEIRKYRRIISQREIATVKMSPNKVVPQPLRSKISLQNFFYCFFRHLSQHRNKNGEIHKRYAFGLCRHQSRQS